jgi:RP/EB family microtubule-associated protein
MNQIEQCATGAVYCQILDSIFPGSVSLSKVKWDAKSNHEFVANFKILQQAFSKHNITRYIDAAKLTKAKYQDNLEMLQWMKAYFDMNHQEGTEYDALSRRKGADLHLLKGASKLCSSTNGAAPK